MWRQVEAYRGEGMGKGKAVWLCEAQVRCGAAQCSGSAGAAQCGARAFSTSTSTSIKYKYKFKYVYGEKCSYKYKQHSAERVPSV